MCCKYKQKTIIMINNRTIKIKMQEKIAKLIYYSIFEPTNKILNSNEKKLLFNFNTPDVVFCSEYFCASRNSFRNSN